MKVSVSYDFVKQIAIGVAENIEKEYRPDCIYAVMRGGMTIAHIIAKHLKLPVYGINIQSDLFQIPVTWSKKPLFVEDLIATGRTLHIIRTTMASADYRIATFLLDGSFDESKYYPKIYYGIKTSQWIVFPWEAQECVMEGDRGLFRDGTDKYGK